MSALRQEGGDGLKAKKVLAARTKLYFGVANFQTGKPKLIRPTSAKDLFTAVQASILMPNVSKDIVHLDNIRYADGGFTKPHVLELVFEEIEMTHLLMITNQDHIDKVIPNLPWLERFLNHTLFRWRMPKLLRFAAHERWKERMKAVVRMRKNTTVAHALVWGDRSIRSMERDEKKVKRVVERSRQWWHEVLSD
jgi:predicted patatin/cPLA2 family phospholipase